MDIPVFEKLREERIITDIDLEKVKIFQHSQPVAVYWELRSLLYFGILLLTTGVAIIIYKNINTIGHDVIVSAIALSCAGCFLYCFKKSKNYSNTKVTSPNVWFDYVILLGCLLLVTLVAYVQFIYNAFGKEWGLATFIPMVVLFMSAYYFDHIGILSLAITNLAAWIGITITPIQILTDNDFSGERVILSGICLGAGLVAFAALGAKRNIKIHFEFTYKNFGAHILFIALLAALFHFENIYLLIILAFAIIAYFFYKNALKENSFYFLVITLLYSYIAAGYFFVRIFEMAGDSIGAIYLGLIYFIASGIALIRVLMYFNKTINSNDSI
ncbi:MAG: DUF2157 domain-containing protein [Panacibacter sp.]